MGGQTASYLGNILGRHDKIKARDGIETKGPKIDEF